jgi:glucose-1-phosphate thymidylyltransferase
MKCIILAGGFATRLWPLSENKAKPLLHLKDRPIISHIVEGLPADLDIIVSTNAVFSEELRAWAKGYPERSIRIFVEDSAANESKKGALGAVSLVIQAEKLDDDLLLILGDNYCGFKFSNFINAYQGNPLLAAYDLGDLNLARKYGVVVAEKGIAREFQEKPQEPKSTLVSTGCYLFPKSVLPDIVDYAAKKKDDVGGIFEHLLKKGVVIQTFSFKEKWYDIGSFDAYLKANKELLDGQVIEKSGVRKLGKNTLKGGVYLGENTVVEDCVIEDSVILRNSALKNCVIRSCVVDERCALSGIDLNRQMIRRGSVIKKITNI